MTVSVELAVETVDSLVFSDLEFQYQTLKRELNAAKAGHSTHWFSMDQEVEIKELKRLAKSFKIVLDFYSVGGKYNG